MRMMKLWFVALVVFGTLALSLSAESAESVCTGLSRRACRRQRKSQCLYWRRTKSCQRAPKVYFVGNSFTSSRTKLDSVFKNLAKGKDKIALVSKRTKGGYTIRRHVADGVISQLPRRVGSEGFLVLQEQSQHFSFSESWWGTYSQPYIQQFKDAATALNSETLLYETWGYHMGDVYNFNPDSYDAMQARITNGYATVAQRTGARVCPAGQVWAAMADYFRSNSQDFKSLYRADLKHPSLLGHYTVACAFYACIFGESPQGSRYVPRGISKALAAKAQELAAQIVLN